jgi:ferredoxin
MSECIRVTVDGTRCTLSTTCLVIAPELFHIPEGADAAAAKHDRIDDPELIGLAREAEESCPTEAIVVERVD